MEGFTRDVMVRVVSTLIVVLVLYILFEYVIKKKDCACKGKTEPVKQPEQTTTATVQNQAAALLSGWSITG